MKDLVEIDEYKLYAKISSTEQDERLELLVPAISSLVKSYCARSFLDYYDIDKEEYYNGGDSIYYTEEFPIRSITSVGYSTDYGQTYTSLVAFTDFVLDKQKDRLFILGGETVDMPNAYKITFKAGFAVLPAELKLAIFDLIDYYLKKESTPKKSAGSVAIEYITNSDLPPHIKRVLDLYRSVR